MKLYLSSYKFPDNTRSLTNLFMENKKVAYISNALDFSTDVERRKKSEQEQIEKLIQLGLKPELVDLRLFFDKHEELKQKMSTFGGVWVNGGNAFVLLAAYKLSSFDSILKMYSNDQSKSEFVYAGFSAAGCVLHTDMKGVDIVDTPQITHEVYNIDPIWKGVGIINFRFVPHFDSDHPESEDTNIEIDYYKKNNIEYVPIRDGEVLIWDTLTSKSSGK